ncbi:MAG TPA: MarC family protein [Dongiaceae bacterium]|jgi:multiple antibiotic resistance protein|nr:MarC family protein [Dongiaceae bacterium]
MNASAQTFLLALSALFSIVNPIGVAFIFSTVTASRSHAERLQLAARIAFYSALVMLVALWGGAYVLSFFGISLAALRIAGGIVVGINAWLLLQAPERTEERKQQQAAESEGIDAVAFFPLTIPFTTGPGTMSVAIALGSNRPNSGPEALSFVLGASAAAVVVALIIWVTYAFADRLTAMLGRSKAQVVTRLAAFLLLCVGTQIAMNGVADFARSL